MYKPFEITVGKGEIARNDASCFLIFWKTFLPFSSNLKLLSANFFRRFGKGLMFLLLDAIVEIQAKLLSTVLAGAMERLSGRPRSELKRFKALEALACWTHLWCGSQGAELRDTSTILSYKNLFPNQCKIDMFELSNLRKAASEKIWGKGENAYK